MSLYDINFQVRHLPCCPIDLINPPLLLEAQYTLSVANLAATMKKRFNFTHICCSENTMTLHIQLIPLLSILAGILILLSPKLLNYVVAIYLIAIGLIQIFGLKI
tara:strand:+ start:9428 stop:9742 length:315 start_codon:yes stop_codon:yes gene_type:complete